MTVRVLKAPSVIIEGEDSSSSAALSEALEAAFSRGREHGRQEATAGLEAAVVELRTALDARGRELDESVAASVRLGAEEIVALATDLASWALEGVISADPAIVAASTERALRAMSGESAIALYVHPDVADVLGNAAALGVSVVRADNDLDVADFRLVADGAMVERCFKQSMKELAPELAACLQGSRDVTPD